MRDTEWGVTHYCSCQRALQQYCKGSIGILWPHAPLRSVLTTFGTSTAR
jgi:hypothetical protein